MSKTYNPELVERIGPEYNSFMSRADQVRWSPSDIPYNKIDRSKLTIADVFALFVTLHIENYSDVYTNLLTSSFDDVPLIKSFTLNWEREEENHARALEAYLLALGMPLSELEANYSKVNKAEFPIPSRDQTELNAFVFLQELFTREMYAKMLRTAQEPVLRDLLKRVVRDEERHFRFYKQTLALRLELDRKGTLGAIRNIFKKFGMPQTMYRQSAMTDKLIEYFPYSGQEMLAIIRPIAAVIEEKPLRFLSKTPKLQWIWQNRHMILFAARSSYLHKHLKQLIRQKLRFGAVSKSDQKYVEQSVSRLMELLNLNRFEELAEHGLAAQS